MPRLTLAQFFARYFTYLLPSVLIVYIVLESYQLDFRSFYIGGKLVLLGLDPYINAVNELPALYSPMNADATANSGFIYPPIASFLFVPLAMLPYQGAKLLYSGVSLLGLWALLWSLMRQIRWTVSGGAIALVMCSFPVLAHFERGQIDLWVCYLTVLSLLAWQTTTLKRQWRSTLSAALLAIACVIKIFPFVILLYWCTKRQWSLVSKTTGAILFLLLSPIVYFGPSVYYHYLQTLYPQFFGYITATEPIQLHGQTVVNGVVRAIDGNGLRLDHDFVNGYMNPLMKHFTVSLPVGLCSLGILLICLRRQPITQQFFTVFNAIHLINPKTWIMGLVWYIPLFLYWFDRANHRGKLMLVLPLFLPPSTNVNGMLAYAIALVFSLPQLRDRDLIEPHDTNQENAPTVATHLPSH